VALRSRGGRDAGYTFEVYVDFADRVIGYLTEAVCDCSEDPDCWESMSGLWLPFVEDEEAERVLFIDKLALASGGRGHGWGRRFVLELEGWGRKHGAVGSVLHAASLWGGDLSEPFWEHMGYDVLETLSNGTVVMTKDLR